MEAQKNFRNVAYRAYRVVSQSKGTPMRTPIYCCETSGFDMPETCLSALVQAWSERHGHAVLLDGSSESKSARAVEARCRVL